MRFTCSGIGLGLPHNGHIVIGTILITISVIALAVVMFVYNKSSQQGDKMDESKARQWDKRLNCYSCDMRAEIFREPGDYCLQCW